MHLYNTALNFWNHKKGSMIFSVITASDKSLLQKLSDKDLTDKSFKIKLCLLTTEELNNFHMKLRTHEKISMKKC